MRIGCLQTARYNQNSPTAQSPEKFEYDLEMREKGRLSWPVVDVDVDMDEEQ
jgi:hypothetical protein